MLCIINIKLNYSRSYFRVDSQVFGSSATGLALEDSDVDLVVLGLLVFNKS